MNKSKKIAILKQYKMYLLYLKETQENMQEEIKPKEKQKVFVLKKPFYGKDLIVG